MPFCDLLLSLLYRRGGSDKDRWSCLLKVTKQFSSGAALLISSTVSEARLSFFPRGCWREAYHPFFQCPFPVVEQSEIVWTGEASGLPKACQISLPHLPVRGAARQEPAGGRGTAAQALPGRWAETPSGPVEDGNVRSIIYFKLIFLMRVKDQMYL